MKIQKYQIFSSTGTRVCVVEAGYVSAYNKEHIIELYKDENGYDKLCTIPSNWCAIPVNAILEDKP